MQRMTFQKKVYLTINGKEFFLIRGYQRDRTGFIFVQVSGKYTLSKEDLPNKDWAVLATRAGKDRIFTAWRRPFFTYEGGSNSSVAFVAASYQAAVFLALRFLDQRFQGKHPLAELVRRSASTDIAFLKPLPDLGNAGIDGVLLETDTFDLREQFLCHMKGMPYE